MSIKEYVNTSSFFVVGIVSVMGVAACVKTHERQRIAEENKPDMITVMHRGLDGVIVDTLEQGEGLHLAWANRLPGIYATGTRATGVDQRVVTYKTNHGVQTVFPAENQYLVRALPTSAR